MLVLSREVGQSLLIEDVRLTVVRFCESYAEISLQKVSGGKTVVMTLSRNEGIAACYDVTVIYVHSRDSKIRLGIDAPQEVHVSREEMLER